MRFVPDVSILDPFPRFPPEVVREERSQDRVSCDAGRAGGPIHRAFVDALPPEWQADPTVEIFSRLTWVKPGWLPLSPAFHCDWAKASGSGPGLVPQRVETRMAMAGGCTSTEFVIDPIDLPDYPGRKNRWALWTARVTEAVESGALRTVRMHDGAMFRFDNRTWHRPTPAVESGWRILLRAIRGLDGEQAPTGTFTTVRNGYEPRTMAEAALYAPYR